MSADRWAECANCAALTERQIATKQREVDAAYGRIPFDDFNELRAELEAMRRATDDPAPTLREDYEIFLEGTEFYVSYSGRCTACKWGHNFTHQQEISVEVTP